MQTKCHMTKINKISLFKFPHVEKFRRQWNVNHIYSYKNSEMTNSCRKLRNRFKRENLLSSHNIWNSRQITADIKEKLRNQEEVLCGEGISLIYLLFLIKQMETMPRSYQVSHVISEWHWKSTFDFTEIVNKYGLKQGTVCQIVRFISHFSLKLYIQYIKYFHSMVLGSVGRDYSKKNRVLEFLARLTPCL